MALNANDIAVLADEVASEAMGGRVQKVRDGRDGEVHIELRVPGRNVRVLIAAGSSDARILLASVEPVRRPSPTAFVQLLRKRLVGSRLAAMGVLDGDRVVDLRFEGRDDEGNVSYWRIVAELTGRHGNLFLVDRDSVIRGAMRGNVSHRRELVSGETWQPPAPPPEHLASEPSVLVRGSASRLVEERVEAEIEAREALSARNGLLRDLRRARKRLRRRLEQVTRDEERADRADQLQRWGELLQSAWGQVPTGADAAVVPDYFDPELPMVRVPLDPSRSLSDNVARYFKEAKRLKAARSRIAGRLADARAALQKVEAAIEDVAPDADEETVEAQRASLIAGGVLPKRAVARPRERRAPEQSVPYWTFKSRSGATILVGKSARDNDRLTLRTARGRDLWLHVDGAAGSHVVVRLEKGAEVDHETLLDAAALAVHYSKRRDDTGAEVRFTKRKFVSKPKGAAPGLVTLAGAKSIYVKPDPGRIERLFETREL